MPTLAELEAEKARRQGGGALPPMATATLDQLMEEKRRRQPESGVGESLRDMARGVGPSLRRGTESALAFPAQVNEFTQTQAGRVARAIFGDQPWLNDIGSAVSDNSEGFGLNDIRKQTDPLFGGPTTYEPTTTAGRYSSAVVEQIPGAVLGPGGLLRKGLQAVMSGVGGEGAGDLAKAYAPEYEDLARFGGGFAGGLGAGRIRIGEAAEEATRAANRAANVRTLTDEGVPLSAGQRTGSKFQQRLESEVGGSQFDELLDRQKSVFTDRAMRRTGEAGGAALPEDLTRAADRIGGTMNQLAAQTTVPFDPGLQNALVNIGARYEQVAPLQAPGVRQMFNSIIDKSSLNGGQLDGDQYQEMVTVLRTMGEGADPAMQEALNGFRGALDDAVERSLSGAQLAQWRQARNQYANLMTVERAMTGAGIEAATGMVSPPQLRSAISGGPNSARTVAEGRSGMTDLANAGTSVLKDMPPNSGTAARSHVRLGIGAAGGIGAGLATGDMSTVPGGLVAGLLAPELAGRAVMSGPAQFMQGMPGATPDQRSLLAAILAGKVAAQPDDRRR